MTARKKPLGKSRSIVGGDIVFQTADGFEIERTDHYKVEELRVFYDDVVLVTLHREMGLAFVIITGLLSLFFAAVGLFFLFIDDETWPAAVAFFVMGAPFLIAFLVRIVLQVDVVTIFGRRSKGRMRFTFNKGRARDVYEQVGAAVRNAHRRRVPDPLPDPVSEP